MSTSLINPSYAPDLFLNRGEEVQYVSTLTQNLLTNYTVDKRTVVFEGERGKGKSWLTLHLHRTILSQEGVKSLLFAFDTGSTPSDRDDEWYFRSYLDRNPSSEDVDLFAHAILRFACQQVGATDVADASLEERSFWLIRALQEKRKAKVFAVILDSMSELRQTWTELIERSFLASIAALPNVLIIMTGRPPLPLWRSPHLRVDAERMVLHPFSKELLRRLLLQQAAGKSGLDTLIDQSQGNPGATLRLAIAETDESESVLDGMLDLFSEDGQRKQARTTVEALCVFVAGFREEEMKRLLAAYRAVDVETISDSEVRALRDQLINARILSWGQDQGGYVLDEAIGSMAAFYMRTVKPELWRLLHEQARDMYLAYAGRSVRHSEHYAKIANKHNERIGLLRSTLTESESFASNLDPQKPDSDNNTPNNDPLASVVTTH